MLGCTAPYLLPALSLKNNHGMAWSHDLFNFQMANIVQASVHARMEQGASRHVVGVWGVVPDMWGCVVGPGASVTQSLPESKPVCEQLDVILLMPCTNGALIGLVVVFK